MLNVSTIREWLAGKSSRTALVAFRDNNDDSDNACIMSSSMPQIVDMLVDCMMDNPRFALAISEASRCYKTHQYAQTNSSSVRRRR